MADNRIDATYEQEREPPNSAGFRLRQEVEALRTAEQTEAVVQQTQTERADVVADETVTEEGRGFFGDIGAGILETPKQIVGGVLDATKELAQTMESVLPLGTLDKPFDSEAVTEESFIQVDEAETVTGGLVRGVSQFLTGFIPAMKAGKAIGVGNQAVRAMGAGAVTDAFAFDPHEERLSNLIEKYPDLNNPVTEYLAANPDDTEAEGRFKNAIEGLALGGLTDAFFRSIKLMREGRQANVQRRQEQLETTQLERQAELDVEQQIAKETEDPKPSDKIAENLGTSKQSLEEVVIDEDRVITDVFDDSGKAININLNHIESEDDVINLIQDTANKFTKEIESARRGKISLDDTAMLADTMGMSVDQLLARRRGQAFNAEEAVAARKLLVASSETAVNLARKAAQTGAAEDKYAMMKAIAFQRAIQEQVSGLTAEAGRALSSFRISATSGADQLDQIQRVIDAGGKTVDEMVEVLSMADNPAAVNKAVDEAAKAGFKDVATEAWYASILSSPATQIVNLVGNGLNVFWNAGIRTMTPVVGRVFGDQETTIAEAGWALYGAVQGARNGFVLAGKALKSSDFQLEGLGTLDKPVVTRRAISKETFNLTGPMGTGMDWLGSVIRTPLRALTAGDAFFRATNYQMELQALAYRTARDEGLQGAEAANRMRQIIESPPEELVKQAESFSRVQTFTNDLGKQGAALQTFANESMWTKLLIPFVRTPVNIIKNVGVNSPLAPFASSVRADIRAGGARRDKAIAQITAGSSVMAATASLQAEGVITGAGPADRNLKRTLELSGWKPFSVKIGDTYYAYNRLDPIGATIGIAAEFSEISGNATDSDFLDVATTATLAVAKNVASKTYLQGVSQFFNALYTAQTDPTKENRSLKRFAVNLASGFMPFSSLSGAVERGLDPEQRAVELDLGTVNALMERIKSRTPGFSEDLPAVLNVFGEPVMNDGGLVYNIMSPVYTSVVKDDPIVDELVRIEMPLTMPPNMIEGIRLTTQEYHDYVKLAGKEFKANNKNYKQALEAEMRRSRYKRATLEAKQISVKRITEGYRKGAKAEFIKRNPEFADKLEAARKEKRLSLLGR